MDGDNFDERENYFLQQSQFMVEQLRTANPYRYPSTLVQSSNNIANNNIVNNIGNTSNNPYSDLHSFYQPPSPSVVRSSRTYSNSPITTASNDSQSTTTESPSDIQESIQREEPLVKKGRKGVAAERPWTDDEISTLINLWSSKEVLFKASHNDYHDKNKKQLALQEIANEMGISDNLVQKKMSSLRTYFGAVHGNYKKSITKSGNGRGAVKKPVWPWYEPLLFLKDNISARTTTSNLNTYDFSYDAETCDTVKKRRTGNTNNFSHESFFAEQSDMMKKACKVLETTETSKEKTKDSDDIFGEMIADSLRKIPECDAKEELKLEMQGLILKTKRSLKFS